MLIAALASGLLAASVCAQEAAEDGTGRPAARRTISLGEVLTRARERPPAVRAALAALDRVEAEQAVARAAYHPRLTAEGVGGAGYSNQLVVPGLPRVVSTSLRTQGGATLDWAAIDFSRGSRVQEARAARLSQAAAAESTQREAVREAAVLYVRALAARQLVADARLTVSRRRDQYETIRTLVDAGMRPAVDAQRARIEVIQAEKLVEMQAVTEHAAMAALAAAIGEDPTLLVQPQPLDDDPFRAPADSVEAARLALTHRPELRQLEGTVAAREAARKATVGARLPSVGVSGSGTVTYLKQLKDDQFSITGSQYEAYGGVYLRWAAVDAVTWRRAEVARRAVTEAEQQLAAFVQTIRAEAVEAAYVAQRAAAQRELAAQVLAAAEVTRRAQGERYRAGAASLLELLDAEELEQRARQQRIEAEREHHIARARLLAACGLLDRVAR